MPALAGARDQLCGLLLRKGIRGRRQLQLLWQGRMQLEERVTGALRPRTQLGVDGDLPRASTEIGGHEHNILPKQHKSCMSLL